MHFSFILNLIEGYILALLFFVQSIFSSYELYIQNSYGILELLNDVLRPFLFSLILFTSSKKVPKKFNPNIGLGIALSYIPFFFLRTDHSTWEGLPSNSLFISNIFYLSLLFIAIFQMRNHFTVLPGYKKLVRNGLYSIVRHPIYATYIHLALINLLIEPNPKNTVLTGLIYLGLEIRSIEEERFIQKSESDYYYKMPKFKFFHWIITLPLLLTCIVCIWNYSSKGKKSLTVDLAYPVYSLNPLVADDWSSFFVINHIYPRFNSSTGITRSNSIFDSKEVSCKGNKPVYTSECETVQVRFKLKDGLESCSGEKYSYDQFKTEITQIVKKKNWIFPDFKFCGDNCIEFTRVDNVQNHFDSIYLRFGWLNQDKEVYGIKPNCFRPHQIKDGIIQGGIISSSEGEVILKTNTNDADIVLYGNKPLDKNYSSLNVYNPIYFFLVSKIKFDKDTIREIGMVLNKHGLITKINPQDRKIPESKITVIIPDYFPNCRLISEELSKKNLHRFECMNISLYTEKVVKAGLPFEGFISPLTPGMPGETGIKKQYFDLNSNDNWLGNSIKTEAYLIGSADGVIQVRKGTICSIRPNSLGLSDIAIEDFVNC